MGWHMEFILLLSVVVSFILVIVLKGEWSRPIAATVLLIMSAIFLIYCYMNTLPAVLCAVAVTYLALRISVRRDNSVSSSNDDFSTDSDASAVALIDEAVEVINDMLEVGLIAHIFSEIENEGFIIVTPGTISYEQKYNLSGFYIQMHSISDLRSCRHRYPLYDQKPEWAEEMRKLDRFIQKYSYCYDPVEKAYVYKTRKNIPIKPSRKKNVTNVAVSKETLLQEVAARCPLADMSGTPIHNKKIAR